ncbi:aminotransferase class V-fold PLP-dependent enzyme [Oceanobacillus jeddahense]|uniref:Aminotransferase class V-fold PLP-dependent enzyme n=1 Tax=Oceanobacillus jeddahense TaxID=1462527 RepID=A0ABY5JXK8_9BACI|nr:aminotransferase class V-fold PLP-dependent enzyme [Oceanobacillus jeddahense]UUI04534.1 aminotransferase class V-fold PLP-dependent enzyme [Oceanobacillus jeddahense]
MSVQKVKELQYEGEFFSSQLQKEIKEKFYFLDNDPNYGERLFFENSGGSLRLKSVVEIKEFIERFPDCPDRVHPRSIDLQQIKKQGIEDMTKVIFGADNGSIITQLSASQVMFQIAETIAENVPGKNIVTSAMEHPSAYDAASYAAQKMDMELRVAKVNPETGGIDAAEVASLVDKDTCFISIMSASNISGTIMDMKEITAQARKIKPDLYVITDAVQHAPHGVIDVKDTGVDAVTMAPYKFFGNRGIGIGWVSPRLANLRHHKLLAKKSDEWELGSPTPSNYASISAIVDYVCWIGKHYSDTKDRRELFMKGMEKIHLHERALLSALLNGTENVRGLRQNSNVTVYTDTESLLYKDLIVAIGFNHLDYTAAAREYEKRGCIVFERIMGSPYSERMLIALGIPGAIRISPMHCHDIADIEKFLQITDSISELNKIEN